MYRDENIFLPCPWRREMLRAGLEGAGAGASPESSAACADAPGRAWPLQCPVPSVQGQLYKRINPLNNFSLPGALPALVSCSRSISWALRAGSSRGSGDDISMEVCGADPPEWGERRASASRGGGSCLQSDSLCLQPLRNSSGDESHSFFLAWFFRAFFKLSQLGRSVAAVSRFRIILSVIAF